MWSVYYPSFPLEYHSNRSFYINYDITPTLIVYRGVYSPQPRRRQSCTGQARCFFSPPDTGGKAESQQFDIQTVARAVIGSDVLGQSCNNTVNRITQNKLSRKRGYIAFIVSLRWQRMWTGLWSGSRPPVLRGGRGGTRPKSWRKMRTLCVRILPLT